MNRLIRPSPFLNCEKDGAFRLASNNDKCLFLHYILGTVEIQKTRKEGYTLKKKHIYTFVYPLNIKKQNLNRVKLLVM